MNHKCIVRILTGVAILLLVLKESTESELDPLGVNVCSVIKTRASRLKRIIEDCRWQGMDCSVDATSTWSDCTSTEPNITRCQPVKNKPHKRKPK